MSKEQNIHTQKSFGEAVNTNDLQRFKDLLSPHVVDHNPAPTQRPGPQGFIDFFAEFIAAFPDLAIDVEHMVADDHNVAIAYTITGTQRGDFMGVPPTGRRIRASGLQIARFEDGRIVERWGSSDQLGILQQIGAI
jgi:steroid delta-isomerase-like uncharacterized protein